MSGTHPESPDAQAAGPRLAADALLREEPDEEEEEDEEEGEEEGEEDSDGNEDEGYSE